MVINLSNLLLVALILFILVLKPNLNIAILLLICILIFSFTRPEITEGFESYDNCIEQGYPQDFCLHVPPQSLDSDEEYINKNIPNPMPTTTPPFPDNKPLPEKQPVNHWCRPGEWCKPKWIKNIYDCR